MQKSMWTKGLVLGLLLLFIGASVLPSSSGDTEKSRSIVNQEESTHTEVQQTFFGDPPPMEWNKSYGGEHLDEGWSVQQTADGGYILTGFYDYDPENHHGDLWLIKTDANGNETWNKSYGGLYNDYGFSVKQTTDGGYIITGGTQDSSGYYDLYLIKTDTNGSAEWTKTYGTSGNDEIGYDVLEEADGGYIIIAGHGFSLGLWLVKTDNDGNMEWEKTILIGVESGGYQVHKTTDGGYILLGYSRPDFLAYETLLVKTDAEGNTQWYRTFSAGDYYIGRSIDQTNDGGYIITGTTQELDHYDIMLFKTDENGNQTWKQLFSGDYFYMSNYVEQTSDDGYIITGASETGDALVLKTDVNGSEQWVQYYGGTGGNESDGSQWGHEVHQTTHGGYIIIGQTYSPETDVDVYLIKLAPEKPENKPVNPPTIQGPHYGKIHTNYTFSLGAITDPEGDQLYCVWDWGDGTPGSWLGPYTSGSTISTSHAWSKPGNYTIKVKLKDSYGAESDWSAPFFIEIVELKTAFFLGTFKSLSQTEDLIILQARSFIVFPSKAIFNHGRTIVLSKDHHGYLGDTVTLGAGGITVL